MTYKLEHPDHIVDAITLKDQNIFVNTSDLSLVGIHNVTIASFTPNGSPGSIMSFNLSMIDRCKNPHWSMAAT